MASANTGLQILVSKPFIGLESPSRFNREDFFIELNFADFNCLVAKKKYFNTNRLLISDVHFLLTTYY